MFFREILKSGGFGISEPRMVASLMSGQPVGWFAFYSTFYRVFQKQFFTRTKRPKSTPPSEEA